MQELIYDQLHGMCRPLDCTYAPINGPPTSKDIHVGQRYYTWGKGMDLKIVVFMFKHAFH